MAEIAKHVAKGDFNSITEDAVTISRTKLQHAAGAALIKTAKELDKDLTNFLTS